MNKILYILLIALSFSNCKKKKPVDYVVKDEEIITAYISDNNLDAKPTGSGLYYVISSQGTGANPNSNSNVTVKYRGYLTDGTVFDQSTSGFSTSLTKVIKGWQEGIPYFKNGGKGKLLIPSALGYGDQAVSSIPANSVLIFDIELTSVQ